MGKPTANVYVDGFNLYYRALKDTDYKWLDLEKLFDTLLANYDVQIIKYFTARVKPRPNDRDAHVRQNAYLRALRSLQRVEAYFGQFTVHQVRMPLADQNAVPRTVEVIKTEEKGSDVNLAAHLLMDACQSKADFYAVATNDSDLAEPIRMVKEHLGKPVGILYPSDSLSKVLRQLNPDMLRQIRPGPLSASQMPDVVRLPDGGSVSKPVKWT